MTEFVMIVVIVGLSACTRPDLLASAPPSVSLRAPPDIRDACELASARCTQCHSLDPVIALQPNRPADWRRYVRRMRHMPGSAIAPDEETPIVTCLVYRSFGIDAARGVTP